MGNRTVEYLEKFNSGKVCLHPAGTLFGLTCDPFNKNAVDEIYKAKNRPSEKSFLYLCSNLEKALKFWRPLPGTWAEKLEAVWPNHITVVWRMRDDLENKIVSQNGTVGIRVPLYPENAWFKKVLDELAFPIPTTSINYSGESSLTSKDEIAKFCDSHGIYYRDDFFEMEEKAGSMPSTIIKIESEDSFRVLRQGAFDVKSLIDLGLQETR